MFAEWMSLVNKQLAQQVKMEQPKLSHIFSTSTADTVFIVSLMQVHASLLVKFGDKQSPQKF